MATTTENIKSAVSALYQTMGFNDTDSDQSWNSSNTNGTTHPDYLLNDVTVFMSTYYLWVILIIGVPGNLASIFTILSMPTVSSSKAHVAILAAADTCAIIFKITYSEVSKDGLQLTSPGCATIMFLQQFFTTYVNWIVVAMTTERFVAVWFPLRVGRIYTRTKAWCILSIFAYLTASCYACFFWVFEEVNDPVFGYYCRVRKKYNDFISGTFWYWFEGTVTAFLPCTLVLVGNILIIHNIRIAQRAHRHLTNSFDHGGRKAKDQRQITIMLVVVSVVFLVLNVPNAAMYVAKAYWKPKSPYVYEYAQLRFLFRFVHILMDFNHAVNFFLYFLSMSTFRRRFVDAILCRKAKRTPGGGSMYRTSQTYMASSQHEISRSDIHGRSINNIHPLRTNCVISSDSHHSLRSYHSGANHRISSTPTDSTSRVTANSEV